MKKDGKKQLYLLVHTEHNMFFAEAKRTPEGYQPVSGELAGEWDIPEAAIAKTVRLPNSEVYIHTIYTDQVALLNHRSWDMMRRVSLARSAPAFKPGGAGLKVLKSAANVVPLLIAFYLLMQIGGLQADLQQVSDMAQPLQALAIQVDELRTTIEAGVTVTP